MVGIELRKAENTVVRAQKVTHLRRIWEACRTGISSVAARIGDAAAAEYNGILIMAGLGVLVYATFRISGTAGFYALGAALFGLGAWFTRNPAQKG